MDWLKRLTISEKSCKIYICSTPRNGKMEKTKIIWYSDFNPYTHLADDLRRLVERIDQEQLEESGYVEANNVINMIKAMK